MVKLLNETIKQHLISLIFLNQCFINTFHHSNYSNAKKPEIINKSKSKQKIY